MGGVAPDLRIINAHNEQRRPSNDNSLQKMLDQSTAAVQVWQWCKQSRGRKI
jgi:hypothetical protein